MSGGPAPGAADDHAREGRLGSGGDDDAIGGCAALRDDDEVNPAPISTAPSRSAHLKGSSRSRMPPRTVRLMKSAIENRERLLHAEKAEASDVERVADGGADKAAADHCGDGCPWSLADVASLTGEKKDKMEEQALRR